MSGDAAPKKILLGISGGIAAYKAVELARAWTKAGHQVETVMTEMARKLVSPLVISTFTKRKVWFDEDLRSDELGWKIPHITLSDWADVMVIAPCTANVLAMAANGISATLLGATMLACNVPMIFFPAMNSKMWANPATKRNVELLQQRGCTVVDPDSGDLACGYEGKGRLPASEAILDEVDVLLCDKKDYLGRKVLITAGPTHEYIDPVRYISNPSSGRMGYALAAVARRRGASVTLVSGPSGERPPSGVKLRRVTSALEMYEACLEELADADVIIKAAAVSDYRVTEIPARKIKRDGSALSLQLVENPDIARELGQRLRPGQILMGFAAETDDIEANAIAKIERKNLDLIAANDVGREDSGFATATNRIKIHYSPRYKKEPSEVISGTKEEVASAILDRISELKTND